MTAIAERWGIKTTRDDWTQKKPEDSSERKDAA